MLERLEPILKAICLALATLLVFQLARMVARSNPLAHLSIPALPTLSPDTNAPAGSGGTNTHASASGKAGTNVVHLEAQTNTAATNASAGHKPLKSETNAMHVTAEVVNTNSPAVSAATTNLTNLTAESHAVSVGTNSIAGTNSVKTNIAAAMPGVSRRHGSIASGMPAGMSPMGMGPFGRSGAAPAPELPLPVRARVYQITDSELLGPVMRPMPMALLGIVGDTAFLRSANGQTGLAKEGESVGGLKLLQIGINRVLVDDEGQKKELTIFSGYGSESLMPKEKENSK
jgi:hypothetical protein